MIQQLHFWIYAQRIDIRVIIYIPMFREALVTIAKNRNNSNVKRRMDGLTEVRPHSGKAQSTSKE